MCELLRAPELLACGEARAAFDHARGCRACQVDLLKQGAYAAGCVEPHLGHEVQLHLDALAGEGTAPLEVSAHLAVCPACRQEVEDARAALAELGGPAPGPGARISPTCPACEGRVERAHAVACATCASPHHPACFDARGACGLRGCGERRYVRRVSPRRGSFPRWLLGGLLGLVVTAAGEPAQAGVREGTTPAPRPSGHGDRVAPRPRLPLSEPRPTGRGRSVGPLRLRATGVASDPAGPGRGSVALLGCAPSPERHDLYPTHARPVRRRPPPRPRARAGARAQSRR
jgi:hypothetical protein